MKDIFTKIAHKYIKKLSILLILIITSSCQDHACHEADDYGQYQTETLTIKPISDSASCETDQDQNTENEELRKCIVVGPTDTYGTIKYTKSLENEAATNTNGCLSEEKNVDKNDCIASCKIKCQELQQLTTTNDNYEPSWKATTKKSSNMNYGVRISPGSEIYIKASGEVYFGPTNKTTSMYKVKPDLNYSNLLNNSEVDTKYDISTDSYNILFGGKIEETIPEKQNSIITSSGKDVIDDVETDINSEILHLGKKILIHYDYFYDTSKRIVTCDANEDNCKYNEGGDTPYHKIENNTLDSSLYIGMIKKNNACREISDIIDDSEFTASTIDEICHGPHGPDSEAGNIQDLFSGHEDLFSECDQGQCSITGQFSSIFSIINSVEDTITNNSQKHIQYKFFMLNQDQECSTSQLLFNIKDADGNVVKSSKAEPPTSTKAFELDLTNQTFINKVDDFDKYLLYSKELILPPKHSITYNSTGCSNIVALKTSLTEFKITKSGYAKIKLPNGATTCDLKARIINPGANFSHEKLTSNSHDITDPFIDPGYYEYKHSDDPLYNSRNGDGDNNGAIDNEFYIRNGQSILFFPNKCTDLYMQIEKPLPAVMCLNDATEKVEMPNPECIKDDKDPEKCAPIYAGCFDEDSASYCPLCQKEIEDGIITDEKYKFESQPGFDRSTCDNLDDTAKTKCNDCNDKRKNAADVDPTITPDQKICYDFESYTGSIKNITKFTEDILNKDATKGSKYLFGLKKVSEFSNQDGYGVITRVTSLSKDLFRIDKIDGKDYYFAESTPISIENVDEKLLKSYIIPFRVQNSSFSHKISTNKNNIVKDTSDIALIFKSKYTGLKGKYMKVSLCKEDQSGDCTDGSNGIEKIVNFDLADTENPTGDYEINNNGRITKITTNTENDCEEMFDGAQYYCHINDSGSNKSEFDKYRLLFKIFDPQQANCKTKDSEEFNGIVNQAGKCVNIYSDNSGEYKVNIKVKTADTDYSKTIGSVIEPIIEIIDGKEGEQGKVEKTYKALIEDPKYKMIVRISMIAMVTFFGISYLMGVSELNNKEIISRIFKIALIYLFIGSTGWTWFNNLIVTPFIDGTDQIAFLMASSFDNSPELMKAIADKNYGDKSVLFSSIDKTFTLIMSDVVMKKITALIFADFFGWIYCILVLYGMLLYIYAVANAVLIYLTAQIFLSILFTLGPIFILFTLFKQTQDMFDNWLSGIISFSLQQIFLLTTLAFFNILIYEIIKLVLNYRICFGPVWILDIWIAKINLLNWWHVASVPPSLTAASNPGINVNTESFPSFFSVLLIWVVASIMGKFIELMSELAQQISGGISAATLSSGVRQLGNQLKGLAKQAGSKAMDFEVPYLGSVNSNVQRLDKYLFDSGKLAKAERNEKRKQDKVKTSQVNQLKKAANKAEDDYKRNNAHQLSTLSKTDQLHEIQRVRNDAINQEGEKMNLNTDQIDELKRFKGPSYQGDHLMGFVANKAIHSAAGSTTSLNRLDRNAKISLNKSQISEALANEKDEKKRNEIRSAIAGSDLIVEKTALESAKKDLNIFRNMRKNGKKGWELGKEVPLFTNRGPKAGKVGGAFGALGGAVFGVLQTVAKSPIAITKAVTGVKPTKAVKSAATSAKETFKDTKSNLESSYENVKTKDTSAIIFGTKASKLGQSAKEDFKKVLDMAENRRFIHLDPVRSLRKVNLTAKALFQQLRSKQEIDLASTEAGKELVELREEDAASPQSRVSLASSGMMKIAGASVQALARPINAIAQIRSNSSRRAINELTNDEKNNDKITFTTKDIDQKVSSNRKKDIYKKTMTLENSKRTIKKHLPPIPE